MSRIFPAGVATGSLVSEIFQYAKENQFALPACNVIGSSNINAALETAAKLNFLMVDRLLTLVKVYQMKAKKLQF